ncbi:hypothetical protein HUJ05_010507 [Dendroctonus ponderosae]|nr:hypothetical protein HUJ05_010507 [Dendroctonus ponderosae]
MSAICDNPLTFSFITQPGIEFSQFKISFFSLSFFQLRPLCLQPALNSLLLRAFVISMMCNLSHNISPLFHPLRYGRANVKIWAKEYSNGVKILSKVGLNGSTFSTENDLSRQQENVF